MNKPSFLKDLLAAPRPRRAAGTGQRKKPAAAGGKKEPGLYQRLARLYRSMEEAYNACALEAGLSCQGCPTNCCTSFFQHHTYVEWSYLWRGLLELPEQRRRAIVRRAEEYVEQARQALAMNALPGVMCPLNENGLCILYPYRLMICRMHGTRNVFTRPDGQRQVFPGCARFAALPCSAAPPSPDGNNEAGAPLPDARPTLDRTPFYTELAALEMEFHKRAAAPLPRVNLTLAEMIVMGPPRLR